MKPRNSQSFIPVCCYVSHSWGLLSTSTYFFQESLKTRVFGTSALSALSSRTKNASKIKTNFEIKLRPLGDPKLYSKNSVLRGSGPARAPRGPPGVRISRTGGFEIITRYENPWPRASGRPPYKRSKKAEESVANTIATN